jgi:cytoskeletal protein RodZ
MKSHPRGNTTVIAIIAAVVVVGFLGWWFIAGKNANTNSGAPTNQGNVNATANTNLGVPDAPAVTADSDLVAVESTLDQVDLSDTSADTTQLDTYLNEF